MLGVPILFVLAAGWFLYNQTMAFRRAQQSATWPRTKGRIEMARRQLISIDEYGNLTGATILYEYRVNQKKYTGRTVAFAPKLASGRRLLNKYPPGKQVAVYYRPDDPEITTLETGLSRANYVMLATGIVLLVLTIINLVAQLV